MPNKYIHKPWEAPEHILQKANIQLGQYYSEETRFTITRKHVTLVCS